MKSTQNYSLNVVVLQAFNEFVPEGQRSRIIEALMIEYLIDNNSNLKGIATPKDMVTTSNLLQKEIK